MSRYPFKYLYAFVICIVLTIGYPAFAVDATEDISGYEGIVLSEQTDMNVPDEAFALANELYLEGRFEDAILVYEQIIKSGLHSPELYYNLGNAWYRSNRIPHAILNYERAALLSPGDDDIRFNLELARSHLRDRIEELPGFFLNRWWRGVRDIMSTPGWAVLSISAFTGMLVFMAVFLMVSSKTIKQIFFWFSILIFLVSVLSFSLGLDQRNYIKNYNGAIVFAQSVSVKSSPDVNSTDLFIIHEGTKVWVEETIGDWYAVRLSDGNKGWLKKETVKVINPVPDDIL